MDSPTRAAQRHFVPVVLIGSTLLAAHGWSLGDGLFLDDHWHQSRLAQIGWSVPELLDLTTIQPDRFIHLWWQEKPVRWQYARPLSVLLMKAVFAVSNGNPIAQHAVSLVLHVLNAGMVYILCSSLTRHRFWSTVGGLLFVVYSHSVFAVSWLAAQNTLLATTLMLAAMLCYIRASRLNVGPGPHPNSVVPMNGPAFFTVLLLFLLALLSRENALMLPIILIAFDAAFGGRAHAWARRGAYVLMISFAAAYLVWRLAWFNHPLPEVYFRRPDGEGYIAWCLAKLLHYLTASVWLSPMTIGPSGRLHPWREVPGDCLLMIAILSVMAVGYFIACRRVRGFWIWPLWILLSVLPVVPVLATPHSGYLPGVGFAISLVLGPALGNRDRPVPRFGRWSPAAALWFLVATTIYVPIYRALWNSVRAAERYTMTSIIADPPPPVATDVFLINIPFVNIYAPVELTERYYSKTPPPQYHVLTFAPLPFGMDQPCAVERLDGHRLAVSIEGRSYFSGLLGRFLIEGLRDSGRLEKGQVIKGQAFDVKIAEADADGVRQLIFSFTEPLDSERYCFYLMTPESAAQRLRFHGSHAGMGPMFQSAESLELRQTRDQFDAIRAVTARIIRTDLYLTGPPYPGPR